MEGNANLLRGVFRTQFDLKKWAAARNAAQDLERVMNRDAEPTLPLAADQDRAPRR